MTTVKNSAKRSLNMSTEKSELRSLCQVQCAHDLLTGIILEPLMCPKPGPERTALIIAADVLCWALQHDHNKSFEKNLTSYLVYAESKGFTFTDNPLSKAMQTDSDPRDLERMIKLTLDEKGPMPFNMLLGEVRAGLSIEPAALHDVLNNMLSAGLLQLAPTGFYLRG